MSKSIENLQNKCYKGTAKTAIERMSKEEKELKIKELEKQGYEYNRGLHILLTLDTVIPYDFILYCLLIEDKN